MKMLVRRSESLTLAIAFKEPVVTNVLLYSSTPASQSVLRPGSNHFSEGVFGKDELQPYISGGPHVNLHLGSVYR